MNYAYKQQQIRRWDTQDSPTEMCMNQSIIQRTPLYLQRQLLPILVE